MGVETISLATATGYAQSLGLEGDNYGFIPSVGMIVGYVCGVIFIPRYLSQAAAMRICAIIALVGSIAVAVVPNPVFSVCCIFLMALGCSLMWPALWPLAMADLGKFTKLVRLYWPWPSLVVRHAMGARTRTRRFLLSNLLLGQRPLLPLYPLLWACRV